MIKKEPHKKIIACKKAARDVDLSYTILTIYEDLKPKWKSVGMRECNGKSDCGIMKEGKDPEWSECPHLPKL